MVPPGCGLTLKQDNKIKADDFFANVIGLYFSVFFVLFSLFIEKQEKAPHCTGFGSKAPG
jgi:hypothetical protein